MPPLATSMPLVAKLIHSAPTLAVVKVLSSTRHWAPLTPLNGLMLDELASTRFMPSGTMDYGSPPPEAKIQSAISTDPSWSAQSEPMYTPDLKNSICTPGSPACEPDGHSCRRDRWLN